MSTTTPTPSGTAHSHIGKLSPLVWILMSFPLVLVGITIAAVAVIFLAYSLMALYYGLTVVLVSCLTALVKFLGAFYKWATASILFLYRHFVKIWRRLSKWMNTWRNHDHDLPITHRGSQSRTTWSPSTALQTPVVKTPSPALQSKSKIRETPAPIAPLEDKPDASECPICYEEMGTERLPTIGAPCGHVLCRVCRERIVVRAAESNVRPTCHTCRMPYDTVTVTPETLD